MPKRLQPAIFTRKELCHVKGAGCVTWSARAASIVVIALLLLFASGEDFSKASVREWVGLSFFPLGVAVGLAMAWWREALGVVVAASSLSAFYLIDGLLLSGRVVGPWFVIFTSPAALFFASWVWGRVRHGEASAAATRAQGFYETVSRMSRLILESSLK